MAIRNVFIVAGTLLLIAGCSNGVTAPASSLQSGGAAASAKAKAPTTKSAPAAAATSEDPSGECRGVMVIVSGRTDSVCVEEIQ